MPAPAPAPAPAKRRPFARMSALLMTMLVGLTAAATIFVDEIVAVVQADTMWGEYTEITVLDGRPDDPAGGVYSLAVTRGGYRNIVDVYRFVVNGPHLPPGALAPSHRRSFGQVALPESVDIDETQARSAANAWVFANRLLGRRVAHDLAVVVDPSLAGTDHPAARYAGLEVRFGTAAGMLALVGSRGAVTLDSATTPVVSVYRDVGPHPALSISPQVTGTSAGLAYTLVYLEHLAGEPLLPGRKVAVTGAVSGGGFVAPVGGIEPKVRAALAAGVDVLVAPLQNETDVRVALERYDRTGSIDLILVSSVDYMVVELCRRRAAGHHPGSAELHPACW